MFTSDMDRREAMNHILKTVALAAGISLLDLKHLVTAEAGKLSKDSLNRLKMLKVMLSGFDAKVFQNEFGRITPLKPAAQMGIPNVREGMGCSVYMQGVLGASEHCGEFTTCGKNGEPDCSTLQTCHGNGCSDQDYGGGGSGGECRGNDCDGQDCSGLDCCAGNSCTGQKCPELGACVEYTKNMTGLLNQFKNDPYVQGLMEYFHTTDTRQLNSQVVNMLRQKRFITPQQVMGVKPVQQKTLNVRPKTN